MRAVCSQHITTIRIKQMSIITVDRLEVQHPEALDLASRESLIARRNVLLGLWAASRLELPDKEVEAYAWSVHLADFDAPGHDDVVKKVARDFATHGKNIHERVIRDQLREMHAARMKPRYQPASIPYFLITDVAAGEVRDLINSFAASGRLAWL